MNVLQPGPYSILVGGPRPSARAVGVPVGGPADAAALALGNALLGNPADAVGLEIALAGPMLKAERSTAAVVFGAPFSVAILGKETVPAGTTFTLAPGDTLRIGGTPTGARGYLCVAGGFDSPAILGSRSALDPIRAGDNLISPESRCRRRSFGFATSAEAMGEEPGVLRAVDGQQRTWFAADAFFGTTYTVSPNGDRMGVRLVGDKLTRRPGELASEAVAPGAVQITNDGQPVVIGVDGQTIGGYPKIAHVIRADLDTIGQLRPGDSVRFARVTFDEAETAARERARKLDEWLIRGRVSWDR